MMAIKRDEGLFFSFSLKRHTGLGFLEFAKKDAQKHERHACEQEHSG
jgi:hypothetical protein